MLDSLSPLMQLVFVIILIAVLCLVVFANNRRNNKKRYNLKNRNFQKDYYEKRKEKK